MRFPSLTLYTRPRMLAVAVLGFASGLPLPLVLGTLAAWLAEAGVSKTDIGLFAVITTPYVLKFLWSPLMDALPLPFLTRQLGRRRSWLLVTQVLLAISLVGLGLSHPAENLTVTAIWALAVTIASASQDIVVDAYRVELLTPEEQGGGAASVVFGYNVGMRLVGGAFALILADHLPWSAVYALMAALVLVGQAAALWAGEPEREVPAPHPGPLPMGEGVEGAGVAENVLKTAIVAPFTQFIARPGWWVVLLFILCYKLGDAFAGHMLNPFFIDLGFSKTDIGVVGKIYGLGATLAGTFIGGALVYRIGLIRSLWVCGIAQMLAIPVFILQARVGADVGMLAFTVGAENLAAGMGTAAFVAFISTLCSRAYTATQYALLSSIASIGRTWLSAGSGAVAEAFGWEVFFIVSALVAVPGLLLLLCVKKYAMEP
ncbi:MAG: AmpG family muropeptide MFS transporter [Alphaproteobacteria bacterium]|nr:AmpG family muropeptide MFS transporter [Alphaproteobacteria bacterium]